VISMYKEKVSGNVNIHRRHLRLRKILL